MVSPHSCRCNNITMSIYPTRTSANSRLGSHRVRPGISMVVFQKITSIIRKHVHGRNRLVPWTSFHSKSRAACVVGVHPCRNILAAQSHAASRRPPLEPGIECRRCSATADLRHGLHMYVIFDRFWWCGYASICTSLCKIEPLTEPAQRRRLHPNFCKCAFDDLEEIIQPLVIIAGRGYAQHTRCLGLACPEES